MTDKFNFGELVLKADELRESRSASSKKKAAAPVFECVASSGADFVIKRTTASTSKLLVVLVSQEQYCVKDERKGELAALTDKALSSFFSGFGESSIHIGCSWLDCFTNNKANRDGLLTMIKVKSFKQVATSGLIDFNDFIGCHGFNSSYAKRRIEELSSLVEKSSPVVKHIAEVATSVPQCKQRLFTDNFDQFLQVLDVYGLDRTREFINRYAENAFFTEGSDLADAQLFPLSELLSIVPTRKGIEANRYCVRQHAYGDPVSFQFDKLCDYLFNQSAREGVTSLRDWLTYWKDTLLLQIYLSGKIVDKYPHNLLTTHQILSTEAAHIRKIVDKERWAKADATMRDYDYAPKGKYLITHPASPEAMREEAVAQNNCLASYIDSVLAGRCMIFFARKANDPEKSFLTIEVNHASELAQVKARFNREADDDSMRFVAQWCREKGISLGGYASRANKLLAV